MIPIVTESVRAYWEALASTFDDEPDHGLIQPAIRDAWQRLLSQHLPPAPADVVLSRHVAMPDPSSALRRWCQLLRPNGRLLLIEGHWFTGGGIPATECERLMRQHRTSVTIHRLDDEMFWGRPIEDERYIAVSNS